MSILSELYKDEFAMAMESNYFDWGALDNKTLLITGATGLLGKYLIMLLMYRNSVSGSDIRVIAVGRNVNKLRSRLDDVKEAYNCGDRLEYLEHDVQEPFDESINADHIIHMASNTHPRLYATDPIGTELTNIIGTKNLLELASKISCKRFMLCSSGDVYGDNRSEKLLIDEDDCGYINCNTLRAGYIEGKRASEALCQAYKEAKGVDFVTARLCRIFGATMQIEDSKAISQFIKKAVEREDIILKSEGKQTFSYLYIYDAVMAMLTVLLNGKNGEAYNVADKRSYLSLKELAGVLAEAGSGKVIYDLPDEVENKGASDFQSVILNSDKIEGLNWSPAFSLNSGLAKTVEDIRKYR